PLPIFFPSPSPPFPHFSVDENRKVFFNVKGAINVVCRTAQNADLDALSTLAWVSKGWSHWGDTLP
ncbi:MAG: hypothetical protein NC401_09230, partial [Ruminococcus sp.]|nr:hypothetical protein [Ruminococcus sp.]